MNLREPRALSVPVLALALCGILLIPPRVASQQAQPVGQVPTAPTNQPGFLRAPTRIRPLTPAAGAQPQQRGATTPGAVVPGAVSGAAVPGAATPGAEEEGAGEPSMTPEEAAMLDDEDLVTLNLPNTPLEAALDLYAALVRRVLLRPPQLAGGPINLKFEDLTRTEAIEAMNTVFALNAISVIPVGEKFIKVIPSQQAVQEGAPASDLPTEEFSELGQFTTKLVKVSKVKPGDIAQAIQQFASGKVQNSVLVFDDQNFFILRDMAPNVKRMAELIAELDVEIELDYELEVIPIRYGRVDEIYETLNSVLTGQAPSGGFSQGGSRSSGFQSGASRGMSRTGSRSGYSGYSGGNYPSYSPQSASTTPARTGAMTSPGAARSSFAQRLSQVSSAATGGASGQYNILENARITPDYRSNSLIVYAAKEDFKMLTNIVAKIDTLLAQVLIESIILEVSLEKGKDVGVTMVQRPQQFGSWTGAGGSVNGPGLGTNLLNAVFGDGFSYFAQYKDDFAVALSAIATDSNAKVLSRPRIQTTHAVPASFAIGDTVPYPRSSSPYYGVGGVATPYTTYDEKEVLTELSVTPYITPDGLVTLEVRQTIDQLGPPVTIGQDQVPTIRTRFAEATLSIRDRETVILGGFITDRSTEAKSGVPWLKDIPLLGWAFRSKADTKGRTELIVLLRPTILSTPQAAAEIAELERRSLPNAAAAARNFQREEATMAERLEVVPGASGVTNAPAENASGKKKSSRRSRKRE